MTTHRTSGVTTDPADELLDQAEDALDEGDVSRTLALCSQVLGAHPDHPGALFLAADAHREVGALRDAEAAYHRVTTLVAEHAPAWSGLAYVLFDQLEFGRARSACTRAIRLRSVSAEAFYVRGLLRERRGDIAGADRDFVRASRAEPLLFPRPVLLTDAMIEAVVADAARTLHPAIRAYLGQVPILVEEVPPEDVCLQFEPPAPPSEILGVFTGSSLAERSVEDPWSHLPATILLFRRNLQRFALDRTHLLQELQITVFHELGHFLGLSEEDLEARDLD
ncbi:MAG: metallopeptidase family protein [Myxococcales bacterium]|nr:metallopeptidase family protein [Myxococcales bacterium]